jgi:hypothetical protein
MVLWISTVVFFDFPSTLMTSATEFDWSLDLDIQQWLDADIAELFRDNPQNQANREAEDDLPPPGKSPNAE